MSHDGGSSRAVSSPQKQADVDLIRRLQRDINRVETGQRADADETISSGCQAIDRLLPGQGYPRGCLVQWLSGGGLGADYLALLAAREACRDGGALVVVDPWNQFYPPAAAAAGIELGNLIVLRNHAPGRSSGDASRSEDRDLLWSVDQALRCSAVGAVWGPLPAIDERWFRRFQLSAESSGCLGLFLQSLDQARQPSWAEVQWLTGVSRQPRPASSSRAVHHLRLQLTRCRGTQTGKAVELAIDMVSGQVRKC